MKPFKVPTQLKTLGSAQKIPVQRKENGNESESPVEKRQMQMTRGRDLFGGGEMSEPRVLRATKRQVLSTLNNNNSASWSQSQHDTPSTPGGSSDANTDSFPSSFSIQDVESLLHEKMKGKSKFDHRGKCEQMMQYIKKLRACIRWLQEMEGIYIDEKEKSQNDLLKVKNEHEEIEDELKKKVEELEMTIVRSKQSCCSFQENLRKTEAEKEAVTFTLQKEIEAHQAAEKAKVLLTTEIEKCSREVSSINQQVDSLYDINTRLQEYNTSLQIYNSKLQSDVSIAAETISQIQKEKSSLMETLSSLRGHAVALRENLDGAKASLQDGVNQKKDLMEEIEQLRGEIQRSTDVRCQQVAQVETLKTDILKYKECMSKSAAEYEQLAKKTKTLEESFYSQGEQIRTLCGQLEVTNHKLQISETSALQLQRKDSEQKQMIKELQRSLKEVERQSFQGELLRKNLHNTILELKGNIRVFCRVRPLFSEEEFKGMEPSVVQYPMSAELVGRGIDLIYGPGKKYSFTFDKVFGPDAGQEEVFVEISQLVQSALDGYKVCIFAYGQTGSGKTYTMLGKPDVAEQKGIIPRSLEQIFKASQTLALQGWTFRMQASMLEIYTETIRDLLVVNKSGNGDGARAEIGTPVKNYTIKHDQNGNTIVSELTVVDVSKWKEVSSLLHRAAYSRSVGKTSMNEQSSRSHCVFTLRISGVNESTEQQVEGVLNLVDLAGSERLSRSGSTGERLKETQAINKSLACLGDVILAIANREPHVPYRNSKLTYLLQPCLGGDSKTLMFANISPNAKSLNESLCSLRFAAKVNACEIGVPRCHTRIRATDSWLSYK